MVSLFLWMRITRDVSHASSILLCSMHVFMSVDSGIESVFAAIFSISLVIVSGPGNFRS